MLTLSQRLDRVRGFTGVSDKDEKWTKRFISDINDADKLFSNSTRRYYTREEKATELTANQQYYQMPKDMVRVAEVKVKALGQVYPLIQVTSEEEWNRLNVIPAVTASIPQNYFIRGKNEIGLYPLPSMTIDEGLIVSFEPRHRDMVLEDIELTVDINHNDTIFSYDPALAPTNIENYIGAYIQITDGSDGFWYEIININTSANQIIIDNVYQGVSKAGAIAIIGDAPQYPEEYHIAPCYYASMNFFLERKDADSSAQYSGMFQQKLQEYKANYGSKTMGSVIKDTKRQVHNIWTLPPNIIT